MTRIEDLNVDNKINMDNKGNMTIKGKGVKIDKELSFVDIILTLENRITELECEVTNLIAQLGSYKFNSSIRR